MTIKLKEGRMVETQIDRPIKLSQMMAVPAMIKVASREEMIAALEEHLESELQDYNSQEAKDLLYKFSMEGTRGYNQMADEELRHELIEMANELAETGEA